MESTPFAQTIGTNRLQKAIERNRRKQELRGLRTNSSTIEVNTSSRPWKAPSRAAAPTPGPRPVRRAAPSARASEVITLEGVSSRRQGVATGEQLEFSTAMRAAPTKAPARATYTSAKRKVKTKKNHERFSQIMLKSAWAFCGFLLLRLAFSSGGILDYNERKSMLEARVQEIENIKLDNQRTLTEIELIQKDVSTQKKLVRDHLGFIAGDEYLVIFPKDNSKEDDGFSSLGAGLSASL